MHVSAVSQDNLISSESDLDSNSQGLNNSVKNIFFHEENNISDGINLFGQGPNLVRRAPTVYG